jgi:hypothetical protein
MDRATGVPSRLAQSPRENHCRKWLILGTRSTKNSLGRSSPASQGRQQVILSRALPAEPTEKTNNQDRNAEKLEALRRAGVNEFSLNIYRMRLERENWKPESEISVGRRRERILISR